MGQYKGISYPLGGSLQEFVEDKGDAAMLRTSIMNIIFTYLTERVMRPEFGSGLPGKLFEPNDTILQAELETIIKNDVTKWDPRIEIMSLEFNDTLVDNNILRVVIGFRDKKTNEADTKYMELSVDSSGNIIG